MPVHRQTRKKESKQKGMSIPQLRRSFEHIQQYVKKTDYDVAKFRKEWKKVFSKDVSQSAARDYLSYMKERSMKHEGGAQEGGMAPIDYQLRAGIDGVYGQFPAYVAGGFGFANHDSFRMGCGIEDNSPRVPASLGSNLVTKGGGNQKKKRHMTKRRKQKGGAMFPLPSLSTATSELLQRPIFSSAPPSTLQSTQVDWKGMNPLPVGDPSSNPLVHVKAIDPSVYTSSASPLSKVY